MDDHVFICYSRKDENFVLKLATNLKSRGVPVWLDQWDIPSGANWNRTIEAALNECTHLLLVLSPSSVESDEVQSEWLAALNEKKVVVPILYQACRMPFRLKPIQYIDFASRGPDDKTALEQILRVLGTANSTSEKPVAQSEQELEKAFEWVDKGDALNRQGIASKDQSKYGEAIRAYDKAIKINPQLAKAWLGKGSALQNQGKYVEAIKIYDKLIQQNPVDAKPLIEKGVALYGQGKYAEALKAYDMAIKLNPRNEDPWLFKSYALRKLGRNVEAEKADAKVNEIMRQL